MTFAVPRPFITDLGEAAIPVENKTLFGRVIQHLARQWPEHRVIGFPYIVTALQWVSASAVQDEVRTDLLARVRRALAQAALEEDMSVIGYGPVMLLPEDNLVPQDKAMLSRLTRVSAATDIPFTERNPLRMLYQQAHVIAPMTSADDAALRGLTSRWIVG